MSTTQKQYRPVAEGAASGAASAKHGKGPKASNHRKSSQHVASAKDFQPIQAQPGQSLQFKKKNSRGKANGQKASPTSYSIHKRMQGSPSEKASPSKKYRKVCSPNESFADDQLSHEADLPRNNKIIEFDDVDDSDISVDQAGVAEPKAQSLVVLSTSGATKLSFPQEMSLKRNQHPKLEVLQQSLGAQNCHVLDFSNDKVEAAESFIDDDKTRRDSYDDSESGASQLTTADAVLAAQARNNYKLDFADVEIASADGQINLTEANDGPSQKMVEQIDRSVENLESSNSNLTAKSVFNVNAPFFSPTAEVPEEPAQSKEEAPATKGGLGGLEALAQNLESVKNNFTPSTPYVHKFRTEMCKNWELYGKCKYGDECSFAHHRGQLMVKTDVSILYKTKLCKKFSTLGHCPYGVRCQFIHEVKDTQKTAPAQPAPQYQPIAKKPEAKPAKMELSTSSTPFVAQKDSKEYKQAVEEVAQAPSKRPARPVLPSEASALQLSQIVYSDILVHSFHVSVQEYQKKMKMFQKKVGKRRFAIHPPEMQYMNIYSQQLGRLPCFEAVSKQFEKEQRSKLLSASFSGRASSDDELDDEYEGGYFFGDAQAYEHHLDRQLKQLNQSVFMPFPKSEFFASEPFTPFKPVSVLSPSMSGSTASSMEHSGSSFQQQHGAAPSMFAPSQFVV